MSPIQSVLLFVIFHVLFVNGNLIPWENILTQYTLSASDAFDVFFTKVNSLLDEHAPIHKLSKREISLKQKPWITKDIQFLMKVRDKTFKSYCKENDDKLKEK